MDHCVADAHEAVASILKESGAVKPDDESAREQSPDAQ
jgi:hypothetical protein